MTEPRQVLVTGVRNAESIAWHTARAVADAGASVSFSCYSEREADAVRELLGRQPARIFVCDASREDQALQLREQLEAAGITRLDGLVHAIAFAKKGDLAGGITGTTQNSFELCLGTSAYSLIALCAALRPLLAASGSASVVAYTFLGADRAIPHYNIVGVAKAALEAEVRYLAAELGPENIRVNAVSAGPIRTLSAGGIPGFEDVIIEYARRSCLRRNVSVEEVAQVAAFLLGTASSGITGDTIVVDGGFRVSF